MRDDKETEGSPRIVGAVNTTFDILEALQELQTTTVTELANYLDLSAATVYNHLATLDRRGYVIKDGYTYRPSLRFGEIGEEVKREHIPIFESAEKVIKEVSEKTGEVVWVMVEENGQGVFILKEMGAEAVDSGRYDVGDFCPLHCAAPGKAMMAHFSESKVNRIIDRHGLPGVTEYTITNREELMNELGQIREDGLAMSDQEGALGTCTVAAPIQSPDDEVLGALSISGAAIDEDRFKNTLAPLVKKYVNVIEIRVTN